MTLRLRVVAMVRFEDIDDRMPFESGDTSPHVVHCGKVGVQEMWRLDAGDIVVLKDECFELTRLSRPERVWECVLTACADAWLRHEGKNASERRDWLFKHVFTLSNAVVAAEQGTTLDWVQQCKEWKWKWPETDQWNEQ